MVGENTQERRSEAFDAEARQHGPSALTVHERSERSAVSKALRSKKVVVGGIMLLTMVIGVILAPVLSPYDPNDQELGDKLVPPALSSEGSTHLLGTDHLGRDMLSRIMYGGRISLLIGASAVLVSGTIGVTLGLLGGFFGGRVDTLLMRGADIQLAFPQLLLVILILVIFGRSLFTIVLVLAFADWVIYARLMRGRVLVEKQQEYVDAARAIGASNRRILMQHLLPNMVSLIVVVSTLQFGVMILLESSLSFLGIGVQPPTSSWGRMLNDGQTYLAIAWWVSTLPGLAIVFTVLGTNFIGDGLRESLGIE